MNHQQVFDKVARHLLTQGEKAVDRHGNCQYLADNGLKCAIGALFPEGGRSLFHIKTIRFLNLQTNADFMLLREFKEIHDDMDCSKWHQALKEVAKSHNLTFNPPPPSIPKDLHLEIHLPSLCATEKA